MIQFLFLAFCVWVLVQLFGEPTRVEVRTIVLEPTVKRDRVAEYLEQKRLAR